MCIPKNELTHIHTHTQTDNAITLMETHAQKGVDVAANTTTQTVTPTLTTFLTLLPLFDPP